MNSPAKAKMWKDKHMSGIYDEENQKKKTKGHEKFKPGMPQAIMGVKSGRGKNKKIDPANIDYAREALIKLKLLLGARLYMKSPKIEAIFKKQKEHIGDVLHALDTEMENYPRVRNVVTQNAWERQGLKAYWNEYMNEKVDTARRRADHGMDRYLDMLERHWHPKGETAKSGCHCVLWSNQEVEGGVGQREGNVMDNALVA
ncbi:hypothetical protein P171DRAFT_484522 [Karstenula rhodostoma CBS 690.94]|uniref:Uncharacterized protein n=1 Tax=Karstenula rhodostoma CBS 690.94 TaxID=1392251 RepID=A0A9P4UD24_9PLEO|nr:hypothetical protein P171DRAFT_484522 [Karstenula rhodostoma CBS 690.94]